MAYLCHTATTAHLVLHTLTKSYKGNSTICTARAARFLWASYMSSLDCRIRWCLGLSFIDDPHLPTHSQVSDTCSETTVRRSTPASFSLRVCAAAHSLQLRQLLWLCLSYIQVLQHLLIPHLSHLFLRLALWQNLDVVGNGREAELSTTGGGGGHADFWICQQQRPLFQPSLEALKNCSSKACRAQTDARRCAMEKRGSGSGCSTQCVPLLGCTPGLTGLHPLLRV